MVIHTKFYTLIQSTSSPTFCSPSLLFPLRLSSLVFPSSSSCPLLIVRTFFLPSFLRSPYFFLSSIRLFLAYSRFPFPHRQSNSNLTLSFIPLITSTINTTTCPSSPFLSFPLLSSHSIRRSYLLTTHLPTYIPHPSPHSPPHPLPINNKPTNLRTNPISKSMFPFVAKIRGAFRFGRPPCTRLV